LHRHDVPRLVGGCIGPRRQRSAVLVGLEARESRPGDVRVRGTTVPRSFARPPLAQTKLKTAPRTACAHRIDALEWEPRSRNTTTEEVMAKVQKSWSWETTETTETDYEEIGEVEWSEESYQFDLTRVYRQISTGALFYATDSGCSCPSPFE